MKGVKGGRAGGGVLSIGCSSNSSSPDSSSFFFCHSSEKQSILPNDTLELRDLSECGADALSVLKKSPICFL